MVIIIVHLASLVIHVHTDIVEGIISRVNCFSVLEVPPAFGHQSFFHNVQNPIQAAFKGASKQLSASLLHLAIKSRCMYCVQINVFVFVYYIKR